MNSTYEKEKKLNEALEKLNTIKPQNLNLKETISNLDQQKNQIENEKKALLNAPLVHLRMTTETLYY